MYEITRVGVPARKQDASNSFFRCLDDIKSGSAIGLITTDITGFEKLAAPFGYNYILNNLPQHKVINDLEFNVLNIFDNIWQVYGGSTPVDSITNILKYFETQNIKNIYLFTCGSPYVCDMVTNIVLKIRPLNIIDCESPIKICSDNIKAFLNLDTYNINYNLDIEYFDQGLTIFPGVSEYYGVDIDAFFNLLKIHLSDTDKFLYAEILEDGSSYVKCMSFKQVLDNISWFKESKKILTYGVYKK